MPFGVKIFIKCVLLAIF